MKNGTQLKQSAKKLNKAEITDFKKTTTTLNRTAYDTFLDIYVLVVNITLS